MEKKNKVKLSESELRGMVMETVVKAINERVNRMLCEDGGPGDFMPYDLRQRFVNIIRNASHFSEGSVKNEVMKFYKQHFAKVNKQSFILDKLMNFAEQIEAAEISTAHITPGAGSAGNGFGHKDYDANRRSYSSMFEANMGRATDTAGWSSFTGDDYGGYTTHCYYTRENPYSNDSVQMLADRFEKRLGGQYKITAYNNRNMSFGRDYDGDGEYKDKFNSSDVDFVVNITNRDKSNIDDVILVATTAKKMFGAMADYVALVTANIDPEYEDTESLVIRVGLRNTNEPNKDMMPKYSTPYRDQNGDWTSDFERSNFDKPRSWHYSEN